MKIRHSILCVGMSLLSVASMASVTYSDNVLHWSNAEGLYDTGEVFVPKGQTFLTDWTFSISDPASNTTPTLSINAFQIDLHGLNISKGQVSLWEGTPGVNGSTAGDKLIYGPSSPTTYNLTTNTDSFNSPALTAGNYFFAVSWTAAKSGIGGAYGGEYMIQAVPEPEIFALIGIGLCGLILSRRRKSFSRAMISSAMY